MGQNRPLLRCVSFTTFLQVFDFDWIPRIMINNLDVWSDFTQINFITKNSFATTPH